MNKSASERLFEEALVITPGGIHNPARSFRSVGGGAPVFMSRGQGPHVWDEDGNRYIDLVMGWGPLVLGHSNHDVGRSIHEAAQVGVHFGTPTRKEYALAKFLVETLPSIERVRLVNSGSEAVMAAIVIARTYAGKAGIVKFVGCYHGWHEDMLTGSAYSVGAGRSDIYLAPFNDLHQTRRIIEEHHERLAAIIVEPVTGNMGVIVPRPGFLEGLRQLCNDFGLVLIFDEVMTGFRVAYGGAQARYGIRPDITCLGKIIGGGLPIGAYGGTAEVMSVAAPLGNAYQGGTYSGNPLCAAAGLTALNILSHDEGYCGRLEEKATALCSGIAASAQRFGIKLYTEVVGGMFTLYFCAERPVDYESVQLCDGESYTRFFRGMLDAGIYWPSSQFEAAHMSLAHTTEDIDVAIRAAHSIFSLW